MYANNRQVTYGLCSNVFKSCSQRLLPCDYTWRAAQYDLFYARSIGISRYTCILNILLLFANCVCAVNHCRLKELSDKISKQGLGSPSVLRNVVVKQVVIGLSHMAFLLQVT